MNPLSVESVYNEWGSYVYTLAYRLTGAKMDAEDVTQETFLRVHRFLKDFKGGSLKGWLYKITTNTFYLMVEKKKKGAILVDDDRFFHQVPDQFPVDGASSLDKKEAEKEIHKAITALPSDYRTTLVLADLEELSYQDISEILNVPIGTVRSRLFRARAMLKEKLLTERRDR